MNRSSAVYSLSAIILFLFFLICAFIPGARIQQPPTKEPRFIKKIITTDFISEGAAIGDVNHDGKPDIMAGGYWFETPDWIRHRIYPEKRYTTTDFSNSFLNFSMDVNQDGWIDLIRIGLPGEEAVWYKNPGKINGDWRMYPILSNCGNESPMLADVDDDGRPDLICNDPVEKAMIWMKSPSKKGDTLWTRYVIAEGPGTPGTDRYNHGLGFADMNGDGKPDIIITKGWWIAPPDSRKFPWAFHAADLGRDCSQIYALDINHKGKADLISASAHDYGIWWHQHPVSEDDSAWKEHLIFKGFSESHGMAMADINGDGAPDLITGKRYFAHNEHDPGALDPAVLYWFEYKPGKNPSWIPHLIDSNSGVGEQVLTHDMNGDGLPDIVIANKKGLFLFSQTH